MSVAAVPKAELHVHLEGTAPPALVAALARRHGEAVPAGLLDDHGAYRFADFAEFLAQYRRASTVMRTAEDHRDVTYEYLGACAREGAIYVELTASTHHARLAGLPDAQLWAGIARGIDDARAAWGIEARILAAIVRERDTALAERTAREVAAGAHPYVVGVNMAGDEHATPAAAFADAFATVAGAGLGCVVHAGEWGGPESVRAALALPGVTRIAHGVRAVEDPELMAELADRGVVLDVCPTSNVVLGVYGSLDDHPLAALHAAGVRLTLGSDDPPYFGATIGGEYAIAHERLGLSLDDLRTITRTAIDASFAPPAVRARLHAAAA